VQFVLTLLVVGVLGAFLGVAPAVPQKWTHVLQGQQQIIGGALIAVFVAYVGITARAIYRGALDAPEDSDADSDSDSAGSDADSDDDRSEHSFVPPGLAAAASGSAVNPTTPLLARVRARPRVSIFSHIARLLFSLLLLCLSSFIVSRAVSQLGDLLRLGDTLAGLTLLSLATTLPEALLGLVAGKLGRIDVLAAAAAGANIFLLGGCLGVVLVFPSPAYPSESAGELAAMRGGHVSAGAVHARDLLALLIASGLLMAIVHTRASRAFGAVLFASYAAYLVCEVVVWSRGVAH
jgi:Ca2+/H+ antiporter